MNVIESISELKDIKEKAPSCLSTGGGCQPFASKIFQRKMYEKEDYMCGHNLFLKYLTYFCIN